MAFSPLQTPQASSGALTQHAPLRSSTLPTGQHLPVVASIAVPAQHTPVTSTSPLLQFLAASDTTTAHSGPPHPGLHVHRPATHAAPVPLPHCASAVQSQAEVSRGQTMESSGRWRPWSMHRLGATNVDSPCTQSRSRAR